MVPEKPKKKLTSFKTSFGNTYTKTLENARRFWPFRHITIDRVDLELWGSHLTVTRKTDSDIPAEFSVILPRAEFRQECSSDNPSHCNTEIILNSITVVIAPRHGPENGESPFPVPLPGELIPPLPEEVPPEITTHNKGFVKPLITIGGKQSKSPH